MPELCKCGGNAIRVEQERAVGLRCNKCGRETQRTLLRTEAALTAVVNEWNGGNRAGGE